MSDYYQDVGQFHRKFDLPSYLRGEEPQLLRYDVARYRLRFLQEELDELKAGFQDGDLAQVADALVDLVYVALGTAHLLGLDFDAHWDEVQRANLAKERATSGADPRSKRQHALDVVKPEGWQPPDHERLLRGSSEDVPF